VAEALDPKPGTEGEGASAEDVIVETPEEQQAEPGPVEALAAKAGWVPKDQFRGNADSWKPADEFLLVGKDAARSMSRELKGVRDEVSRIARASAQITADKVAERDTYWRGIQAKAVEEGDNDTVEKAVGERLKLKAVSQPDADAPPPETRDFMDKNKAWFGVDPLATMRAKQIAEGLAKEGVSVPDQLRHVERAIKKEFPEHFAAAAKQPAGVQTGRSRNANNASAKKAFADMPQASQDMARDQLRRNGVPLEKTAESYWADVERSERKVG
jgi:hypothetical protein